MGGMLFGFPLGPMAAIAAGIIVVASVAATAALCSSRRSAHASPAHRASVLRVLQRGIAASALAILLVTFSSCAAVNQVTNTVDQVVNKTIASLDSAISQLAQESTDWQNTLD